MMKKVIIAIVIAAILWFLMFNPWMGLQTHFWTTMAISSTILIILSLIWGDIKLRFDFRQVFLGIGIAAALWGVFWVGDKLSSLMFNFSRPQVDSIYAMGNGAQKWLVGLQLLLLTGPAEEIFWRGYIQQKLRERKGALAAMVITLTIYTLIHIWSFNFMLVMATMVAGAVWGFLYFLKPEWLPALVLSHALWDAVVFVILPI